MLSNHTKTGIGWMFCIISCIHSTGLFASPEPANPQHNLITAVQSGSIKQIQQQLKNGEDPDQTDELRETPLHHAVRKDPEIVKILINTGADTNRRNTGGITPMMLAAGAGKEDIVELLKKGGANPGIRDYRGFSVYDWALRGGHIDLAKKLKKEVESATRVLEISDDGTSFADDASVSAKLPSWFKTSFLDIPEDISEALESSKQGVMLFISSEQCSYCKAFLETSLKDETLKGRLMKNFDSIGLDIFDDSEMIGPDGTELRVKEFVLKSKASHTPTLMFFGKGGHLLAKVVGYYPPQRFTLLLDYLEERAYGKMRFRDYLAQRKVKNDFSVKMNSDPLFASPPYILDRSRMAADQPLVVIFETSSCASCQRFHKRVIKDKSIRRLLGKFEVVQLDAESQGIKLITPDGKKTTAANWYEELDLSYAPAVLFFDKQGNEIMRIDSELLVFRMEGTLQMMLDEVPAEKAQLQRWRKTKVIESLKMMSQKN